MHYATRLPVLLKLLLHLIINAYWEPLERKQTADDVESV